MKGNPKSKIREPEEIQNPRAEVGSLLGGTYQIAAHGWPGGPSEISQPRSGWFDGKEICPGGTWESSTVPPGRNIFLRILPATLWLAIFHRRFATLVGGCE